VLRDVTFGLLIRELKTRFGSYRLGYAWALLDPLLMIGAFSLIFGMRGHSGFGGAPAPLFITASYLPFLFFRNVVSKLQSAVNANKGLFCYRQVTLRDLCFPFYPRNSYWHGCGLRTGTRIAVVWF
jgi:capsular polysaccharide transport system permease protein